MDGGMRGGMEAVHRRQGVVFIFNAVIHVSLTRSGRRELGLVGGFLWHSF